MPSGTEGPGVLVTFVLPIVNLITWVVILGLLVYAGRKLIRWLRKWNP